MKLIIYGTPEGKPRPRRGAGGHFYSPKTLWDTVAETQARMVRPRQPLEGPLQIMATFYMPRSKSTPKWVRWCPQKPDGDNIEKATWDAMGRAGWWKDDKQIVVWTGWKRYVGPGESPRAVIEVEQLTENP